MCIIEKCPQSVEQLEERLSRPPAQVVDWIRTTPGDFVFLGAGGKIGPSLCVMAARARKQAGTNQKIFAVSRFSTPGITDYLQNNGIEIIQADLLDHAAVKALPQSENVYFLSGKKFGSTGNEASTWASNTLVPGYVAEHYHHSRIVAYSTGTLYGLTPIAEGGSKETDLVQPIGDYAMSCLGRERIFEYYSSIYSTPIALVRLFYATELRYGVMIDIATKVFNEQSIDLSMSVYNTIWQGDSNAMTLLSLDYAASPPDMLNLTGPLPLSIRRTAEYFSTKFGRAAKLVGSEQTTSCLANSEGMLRRFRFDLLPNETLLEWVSEWVIHQRPTFNKPTMFESRDGSF